MLYENDISHQRLQCASTGQALLRVSAHTNGHHLVVHVRALCVCTQLSHMQVSFVYVCETTRSVNFRCPLAAWLAIRSASEHHEPRTNWQIDDEKRIVRSVHYCNHNNQRLAEKHECWFSYVCDQFSLRVSHRRRRSPETCTYPTTRFDGEWHIIIFFRKLRRQTNNTNKQKKKKNRMNANSNFCHSHTFVVLFSGILMPFYFPLHGTKQRIYVETPTVTKNPQRTDEISKSIIK